MTPAVNRRRRRCESTRTDGHALVAEQPSLEQEQRRRHRSLRIRMEGGRICGRRKGVVKFGSFIGVMVAGLAFGWGAGGANAQFTDGGAVAMDCGVCSCEGDSADGTIEVFDNPSSGERIAKVGGEYMGILETSCGTSVIAVGSTVYELSGVSLTSRTLEVVKMSISDCAEVANVPSSASCFSGSTSTFTLDDGVVMDVTFTLGTWTEGTTYSYKSNVKVQVDGASSVEPTIEDFCLDYDFVSQLFSATVLDTLYVYNFEFAIPSEPTSSDLSVAAAASSAAGAFNCGEVDPTPSPVMTTPAPPPPTPAPVVPEPDPTPVPTTTTEPSTVPVLPPPPPTPSPVLPTTPQPATPTEAPVAVTDPTAAPALVEATAGPAAGATTAPAFVETAAPSVMDTVGPATSAGSTAAPGSGSDTERSTLAPSTGAMEEDACELPENDACTENTSVSFINSGVGSYYDDACDTELAAEGNVPGCDTSSSSLCRTCFFNTPLYMENNPGEDVPDYVDCPCCVLEVYDKDMAANVDGPRCENITPSPTLVTAEPSSTTSASDQRSIEVLAFDDKGWKATSGEGVALAALGLFAALTFFPICSK